MICSVEDLCRKDVINVHNGKRLGMVCDCEVICNDGRIAAIIVMPVQPGFAFKRCEPFRVDWKCITVIGDETILISCECEPERRERRRKGLFPLVFGK